jgi:hypothetical protein
MGVAWALYGVFANGDGVGRQDHSEILDFQVLSVGPESLSSCDICYGMVFCSDSTQRNRWLPFEALNKLFGDVLNQSNDEILTLHR